MKTNVLLTNTPEWTGNAVDRVRNDNPGLIITSNFEQVLATVKSGEVHRIIILWGAFNADGKEAAEKIHAVDKNIPVLIWDSIEEPKIATDNEVYLKCKNFETEEFFDVFQKFYFGCPSFDRKF